MAYGGAWNLSAHSDHRLIQAFVAVGLAAKHPITVSGAIHIAKSYPHFFHDLSKLGAKIEGIY